MNVFFTIEGHDRVIILLVMGEKEGSKFIQDTMMNHYTLSLSEFEKRRAKDKDDYFHTTIGRKITHPKIPFKMKVITHASDYRENSKSMSISFKIEGVTEYRHRYYLKSFLDREIGKHFLGE